MKVRTRCVTGLADTSDLEARTDVLPEPYLDPRQVRVHRPHAVGMRDHDELAPTAVAPARPRDAARARCGDSRAFGRDQIDSRVEPRAARPEAVADRRIEG